MPFLRAIFCVCLLIQPLLSWGDTVWLNNGDRLTGDIVLLDGGKLVLKTKYAGRVLIAWKDIETLRSEKPLLVRRAGFESEHSHQLDAAGKGMVRVVGAKTQTVPLADIDRLIPPRPLIEDWVIDGHLDVKMDMRRDGETKRDEWKVKGISRLEHGRWRHVLSGELERKVKDKNQTADNWQLAYSLDRFLTDNWFWRFSTDQLEDRLYETWRQLSFGAGPGYRFWDNELGSLDVVLQASRMQIDTVNDETRAFERYRFSAGSFGWDYQRLFSGTRFELYSRGTYVVPQIRDVDYVLDSEYGLRYRLNDWMRWSLLYELDQASRSGETRKSKRYLMGLGLAW